MTKLNAALLTLAVTTSLAATSQSANGSLPWKKTLAGAQQKFSQSNTALGEFSEQLTAACDSAQLKHCDKLQPAEVFPTGYRIIPRIDHDAPAGHLDPYKDEYSLQALEKRLAKASRQLASLNLEDGPSQTLVDSFISLRKELANIQLHLQYHDYWQGAAVTHANWFASKRPLSKQAAQLLALKSSDPAVFEQVRNDFSRSISGFKPSNHGVSCRVDQGIAQINLDISTDIESASFRSALKKTVEQRFSGLATQLPLVVRMNLHYLSPAQLYQGRPPAVGSDLDRNDHIRRFGSNKAVITTGVASTHAFLGQRVELGGAPTTLRTLAHEVGHILGFNDVYLRNFVPHQNPKYGVIYSEWKGISNDLMGNNGSGEVTTAMRDTLISNYCFTAK